MKTFWVTDNRFAYIGLILLLIWIGFIIFFSLKADEITRDPCSICSERMGENVVCTTQTFIPINRVYYPNGSVWQEQSQVIRSPPTGYDIYDINITARNYSE